MMEKSPEAYRTIREVAVAMDLPQHVLRFWETRFPQIRPLKRAGGRRYYRPDDIERLRLIKRLLYDEGYTIKGVQKLFKEQGAHALAGAASLDARPPLELRGGHEPERASAQASLPEQPAGSDGFRTSRPASAVQLEAKIAPAEAAALREALSQILDAQRILGQARSPGL
jgi:DNA-binding transcriptional MerR regulator